MTVPIRYTIRERVSAVQEAEVAVVMEVDVESVADAEAAGKKARELTLSFMKGIGKAEAP